eukprot:3684815-Pyramimonas_sp.AAC.1
MCIRDSPSPPPIHATYTSRIAATCCHLLLAQCCHLLVAHCCHLPGAPQDHADLIVQNAVSLVRHALASCYAQHCQAGNISLVFASASKPYAERVVSRAKFEKGKLVLIPLTTSIGSGTKAPATGVVIPQLSLKDAQGRALQVWLNPRSEQPSKDKAGFLVPFWHVGKAVVGGNMAMGSLRVN